MFGRIGTLIEDECVSMAHTYAPISITERQQLVSGAIALLLAVVCMLGLTVTGLEGVLVGVLLGILSVSFFVLGTISIGTSASKRI